MTRIDTITQPAPQPVLPPEDQQRVERLLEASRASYAAGDKSGGDELLDAVGLVRRISSTDQKQP